MRCSLEMRFGIHVTYLKIYVQVGQDVWVEQLHSNHWAITYITIANNRFTCHWSFSSLLVTIICDRAVQDHKCRYVVYHVWSATLRESFWNCVFNENESFCLRWGVPSTNELFRFNRKSNGKKWIRDSTRNRIHTCEVSHKFSGKTYSRAVRGHILCASAVQLILLKTFWNSLNSDQQNELKNIRIRTSIMLCKWWHFDWINGLVINKEKRTNWNITHLSIMDRLYHIYLNCSRIQSSWKK